MNNLPKVINTCTDGVTVVFPLSPAANCFGDIFLDALIEVEVLILVARIVRNIQFLYLSQDQVVVVRKFYRINLFLNIRIPGFWICCPKEIFWVMNVQIIHEAFV